MAYIPEKATEDPREDLRNQGPYRGLYHWGPSSVHIRLRDELKWSQTTQNDLKQPKII